MVIRSGFWVLCLICFDFVDLNVDNVEICSFEEEEEDDRSMDWFWWGLSWWRLGVWVGLGCRGDWEDMWWLWWECVGRGLVETFLLRWLTIIELWLFLMRGGGVDDIWLVMFVAWVRFCFEEFMLSFFFFLFSSWRWSWSGEM